MLGDSRDSSIHRDNVSYIQYFQPVTYIPLASSLPTFSVITIYNCMYYMCVCMYTMYILHVDSSMGIPVQKLQQCPHSTNTKGYRDTVDYRDIFRVTIVIVKFSLSPSPIPITDSHHIKVNRRRR